jgi:hypothetical protein
MMVVFGIEIPLAAVAGFTSALIAGIAALLVWLQWRERQLRQDDVLRWASEVIRTEQTLYLALFLGDSAFDKASMKATLAGIAVDTSVLVEQGRLFFRNTPHPTYGAHRHPAYRGYRPMLLDPIVVAHQIACQWEGAAEEERERMVLVAEDCVRRFVSMAQREVGRSRTAHEESARKGEGETLDMLLARVKPERLAALRANARLSL